MKMASPRHNSESTPICRCRVLYLGSAVPHVTKDGLQGIQEPLRELYPEQGALGARGIDSWLSVWSNGILLENVDENHKKVTRFFPIESLHYCAAVRYVLVPEKSHVNSTSQPRFLPLDSPFARTPNPNHPPLFACILRRTTGIKVLECHTFICKREMAANALVRCCFHAYADSSYLKHIDTGAAPGQGNSIYGTLGNKNHLSSSTNSIEKVEGWRGISSPPPVTSSTLTLDSAVNISSMNNGASLVLNAETSNSNDDMSIYNGDENHKIWAGSTRDISVGDEAIYGEYGTSTMRSTKSSRPRQIVNAPPPPPPPLKEEKSTKKSSKEKSRRKKMTGGSREEMYPLMNGSLLRSGNTVRSQGSAVGMYNQIYSNGTLMHPPSQMMPNYPQNPPMVMVPATLPHPPRFLVQGPGGRTMGKQRAPILPPPNFLPMSAPPSVFIPAGRKGFKPHPLTMEEPIYMPSNRPMSPVSSYQPCHFPHEAYLMQQYATMDPNPKRKGKNKKPMPLIPVGPEPEWIEPAMYHRRERETKNGKNSVGHRSEEEDSENIYGTQGPRKKDKDPKGSKKSLNGIRQEDDSESPYNTGIYRRKGHLNERAFSYSIRQEHRSRSYGSLANLKFTPLPVVPNGGGPPVEAQYLGETISREELKKEREIMQMMQDLELSGGELERSEVPPAVYQQAKQRNAKIRR